MARAGRRSGGAGDEESKREQQRLPAAAASELPLRYTNQSYGATTYQSLETAAPSHAEEGDEPTIVTTIHAANAGGLSPFGRAGRRLLAPAGMLLHGGALVAVGLLCGLGVGVLIGRGGGGGGMGAESVVASVGGAGLPVLGNAFSPQVMWVYVLGWVGLDWLARVRMHTYTYITYICIRKNQTGCGRALHGLPLHRHAPRAALRQGPGMCLYIYLCVCICVRVNWAMLGRRATPPAFALFRPNGAAHAGRVD